jgi:hypothetical protein
VVLFIIVAGLFWVVTLVLLRRHLSTAGATWRSLALMPGVAAVPMRERRRRLWLLVFSYIFAIGNGILLALVPLLIGLFWVTLGIACGEAVSESCGL